MNFPVLSSNSPINQAAITNKQLRLLNVQRHLDNVTRQLSVANIEIDNLQKRNSTNSQLSSKSSKTSSLSWRIKNLSHADHIELQKPIARPSLPNPLFLTRSESKRVSHFYHQERFLLPRPHQQQSSSCSCNASTNQNARLLWKSTQVQHHSRQLFQEVSKERIDNGKLRQDGQRISSGQRSGHTKRYETNTEKPKVEPNNTVFCL